MPAARRPLVILLIGVGLLAVAGVVAMLLLVPPKGGGSGDPLVDRGESIYRVRCMSCHATTTASGIGPGLAGLYQPGGPVLPSGVDYGGKLPNGEPITDEALGAFIRQGGSFQIGTMVGVPITDEELRALIAYMRTLEK
ncbi:cytochrome c [Chloroflexia bacterium SDU3-3]|nr:cytochrome c [Chloroflexia bacterium SDU3-3]